MFSLMFLPRGRQLAAMGRDGRYAEDGGEERFSSLSPSAVAGYSPSFFHFKPAPPAPTLLPTKQGAPPGGGLFPPHLMGGKQSTKRARLVHNHACYRLKHTHGHDTARGGLCLLGRSRCSGCASATAAELPPPPALLPLPLLPSAIPRYSTRGAPWLASKL